MRKIIAQSGHSRQRPLERHDVEEVERIEDDQHRHDTRVAEAEPVRDEDRRLVAREPREAPGREHRTVDLRDVRHPVVVGENRRDDRKARAIARVDDEQRQSDHQRTKRKRHDADRDREDDEQDVDALREPVRPPREEKASAAVHEPGERDHPGDEFLRIRDDRRGHHLLRERNEAESAADVEEHEEPRPQEVAVLEERPVVELQRRDAVPEALLLQLRLLEEERRDEHRHGVEDREDDEDARDAIRLEPAQVELRERGLAAPVNALEENRRQRRAEAERDDGQGRRDRLVLVEPEHHRLHRRDVDDARPRPNEKPVPKVDEMQVLDGNADLGDDQSRDEERRPDQRRQPDVLLDDLPEKRRAHPEEEDAERKRKLHLRLCDRMLSRRDIRRDPVRKIGKGVDLPDRNREQERRKHSAYKPFHVRIIQNVVPEHNPGHNISHTTSN